MVRKDYYKILGVDREATQKEIKKAFRRLARETHPDVNKDKPNARERFSDLAEAYEVLGNPEHRKLYDQGHIDESWFSEQSFDHIRDVFEGRSTQKHSPNHNPKSAPNKSENKDKGSRFNFGDMFNSFVDSVSFSPREDQTSSPKKSKTKSHSAQKGGGLDIEQEMEISLQEAAQGTRKPVNVHLDKNCVLCGGSGQVKGKTCRNCLGQGTIRDTRRLEVKVPAGVRENSKIRVSGEGLQRGQEKGHLLLKIKLQKHAFFQLENQADLRCEVPITFSEAALGAEIKVPTLSSQIKMKIPAGTQGGQVFRLRGKGLPHTKSSTAPGDQYVVMRIVIPKNLSRHQEDLIRQLQESGEQLRNKLYEDSK